MAWSVFYKILEDLKKINYGGSIHLYGNGEPLCDPRIEKMISMAHAIFPDNVIFISTNGDHLKTREDVKRLFDAGLTWMGVSHYDSLNDHLWEMVEFARMVHTPLVKLENTFYNRAGNINIPSMVRLDSCDWINDKAFINYRGDIVLCCSDFKGEVVFGNILNASFSEIYNCDLYNLYRLAHDKGEGKTMPLCDRCNRITS